MVINMMEMIDDQGDLPARQQLVTTTIQKILRDVLNRSGDVSLTREIITFSSRSMKTYSGQHGLTRLTVNYGSHGNQRNIKLRC